MSNKINIPGPIIGPQPVVLDDLLTGKTSKAQKNQISSWGALGYYILKYLPKFFSINLHQNTQKLIAAITKIDSCAAGLRKTANKIAKRLNKVDFTLKMPSRIRELITLSQQLIQLHNADSLKTPESIIAGLTKLVEHNSAGIFGRHISVQHLETLKKAIEIAFSNENTATTQRDPASFLEEPNIQEEQGPIRDTLTYNAEAQTAPENFLENFNSSEEISPILVSVFVANFDTLLKASPIKTTEIITNHFEKLAAINQTGITLRFLRNFDEISSRLPEKALSVFLHHFDAVYSIFPNQTVCAFVQNCDKLLAVSNQEASALFIDKLAIFLKIEPTKTASLFFRYFTQLETALTQKTYQAFLENIDAIYSAFPSKAVSSIFLDLFDTIYVQFPKEIVTAFLRNKERLLQDSRQTTNFLLIHKLSKFLAIEPKEITSLFLENFTEFQENLPTATHRAIIENFDRLYAEAPKMAATTFLINRDQLVSTSKLLAYTIFLQKLNAFLAVDPEKVAELFLEGFTSLRKELSQEAKTAFVSGSHNLYKLFPEKTTAIFLENIKHLDVPTFDHNVYHLIKNIAMDSLEQFLGYFDSLIDNHPEAASEAFFKNFRKIASKLSEQELIKFLHIIAGLSPNEFMKNFQMLQKFVNRKDLTKICTLNADRFAPEVQYTGWNKLFDK